MLRRALRDFAATDPAGTDVEFFKRAGMRFHHFWLETVAFQPPVTLLTAEGETRPVLGRLTLEEDDLVFETESPDLVLRARAFLEPVAGDAVHFHVVEHEDPERAVASVEAGTAVDDVPLEIQDRLVSEHYEPHYRDWPDRPAPALGNRTPRQTAALERRRFKVVELLQAFENASDRRRREGRPPYDFGWMWAELGLDRPATPTA